MANWFSRFFNRMSLNFRYIGNPEVYTPINTEKAISEGYNANAAVYSIVRKDAMKFGSIPTYLFKANDDSGERIENELSKLLNRPNEYQGQDAFRSLVRTYYKITGEAFIWLNRGDLGDMEGRQRLMRPVLEMYVLPSDMMLLVPDPNNVFGCLGYIFDLNGTRLAIPKEDIIHWKDPNLNFDPSTREHLRGFSPLSAGYKTLQQNNDATAAAVRMYQNDGAKGVLSEEVPTRKDPTQEAAITGTINRKINSNDVKGAVAYLQGKWQYLDLGKTNTDLGLLEGKELSMKELCFLFDVPYELFDSQTTFANKEQAQKGWISNSIIPACKQYDDELNRVLLQAFGLVGKAVVKSDFSELPELQDDYAKLVTSLAAAWWMTPNEKREWMGEDPLGSEFDEPYIPTGIIPLSQVESMEDIQRALERQGLND